MRQDSARYSLGTSRFSSSSSSSDLSPPSNSGYSIKRTKTQNTLVCLHADDVPPEYAAWLNLAVLCTARSDPFQQVCNSTCFRQVVASAISWRRPNTPKVELLQLFWECRVVDHIEAHCQCNVQSSFFRHSVVWAFVSAACHCAGIVDLHLRSGLHLDTCPLHHSMANKT